MEYSIFYSWQTDLPNATNRGFIQSALESAAKSIRDDESIRIDPVIDRDTVGVPGAPDIADTILAKIEKSQLFVADVSIINKNDKSRKAPNPNVLVELGYAMKTLGLDRIIMVMNTNYGNPELLPFDLRMRRVITYEMFENEKQRSVERKRVSSTLEHGIRAILLNYEAQEVHEVQAASLLEQAISAVDNAQQNQPYLIREYVKDLRSALLDIAPDFPGESEGNQDDILIQSIQESLDRLIDFARLVDSIATSGSSDAAMIVFKSFDAILDRYNYTPPNFSGSYQQTQQQFYKFVGHEFFVTFISFLIRENRWGLITNLLDEEIYITRSRSGNPDSVSFDSISEHIGLLHDRKQRLKSDRMSIHADMLNERHSNGILKELCPIEQFIDADFFLFLRPERWRPWSTLYMFHHLPKFIVEAKREKNVEKLLQPLGVSNIDELRKLIAKGNTELHQFYRSGFWDSSLDSFDLMTIGSKK